MELDLKCNIKIFFKLTIKHFLETKLLKVTKYFVINLTKLNFFYLINQII
jgi:hypothetical protein